MTTRKKRTAVAGTDSVDEGFDRKSGKSPRRSFVLSFPIRRLSEGSFEAQCCRCLRFSSPVDAVSPEHAWSVLIKAGWTWYTSSVGGTHYASCIECLKSTQSRVLAAAPLPL
jgi:hypothetical protein